MSNVTDLLTAAKAACPMLMLADSEQKNKALLAMADRLEAAAPVILSANREDMEAAREKISPVMLDRLMLDEKRIHGMAEGIRQVAALPDPVGKVLNEYQREDGLVIRKVTVPLGVIAIIYESRPNVTSDAAALAVKSGNACVLRGGKEAYRSAKAITEAMQQGLEDVGLSRDLVSLVSDPSHAGAEELMTARGLVDLLIPRGGAGLIAACVDKAKVPVIQTGTGICHIYVDKAADQDMALSILNNAKTSRPSVCNACEVCLIHQDIADEFLPKLSRLLRDDRAAAGQIPVEFRLDERAQKIVSGTPAGEKDFDTEFLDYILGIAIVDDVKAAALHIGKHSTTHSEAIITDDEAAAAYFTAAVDSSSVYVNASTRFTDGGEFGLGCEMGISTQKLHARGPMGLEELTAYKYVIRGNGHIR